MKFLAIDTSGTHLSVVLKDGETEYYSLLLSCAAKHSVLLMKRIDEIFALAHMSASECDFFACVTGPGSFTGIRIGISTIKGLCFALNKPALAITSFDCLAYAGTDRTLALVDAGHGNCYACEYLDGVAGEPVFLSRGEIEDYAKRGDTFVSSAPLGIKTLIADPCKGLMTAAVQKSGELIPAQKLTALYLRKSSAEEKR